MLNQSPTEANTSALFLKNYLECVEELPVDISKILSAIRDLDITASNIVNEIEELSEQITKSSTEEAKVELYSRLTEILIRLQEIQTEKVFYSSSLFERVDGKYRSVETSYQSDIATKTEEIAATSTAKNASIVQQVLSHLPLKNSSKPGSSASSSTNHSENNNGNGNERNGSKRLRRTRMDTELERAETPKPTVKVETTVTIKEKTAPVPVQQSSTSASNKKTTSANTSTGSNNGNNGKKKMKKKKKVAGTSTATKQTTTSVSIHEEVTIEEDNDDEETYCLCGQVSYGEMILCENDACKIEWFHFSCVSLTSKPKGRWYCPNCRGDRPNVLNKNLRKKS